MASRRGAGDRGRVAQEGRPIVCRDYRRDRRRVPVMKNVIDAEGIRGGACAPLLYGGEVLGVLYACQRVPRTWKPEEIRQLSVIGADTAVAFGRIRERHREEQRAELSERVAHAAARTVDVLGAIAMSLARTEDLVVGIGVLAHHLGMTAELLEPGGDRLAKAPPGDGPGEPVRLRVPVGDEPLGYLRVSGDREPAQAERELVEICADLVALQLQRERAALRAESRVHSEFLDDLLEGRIADVPGMRTRAALLGIEPSAPRYVACVGLRLPMDAGSGDAPPGVTRRVFAHVERCLRLRFPRSIVNPRRGDVVVLLDPEGADLERVDRALREVVAPGEPAADLVAGLGRLCLGFADYADSYAEAALALDVARRRSPAGEVLGQADLGLYGLLARGPSRQSLQSIVENALGPLIESDTTAGTEYVKTLHAYLDADRHLERAAADLHVHPNTVRYRLSKVQDMLGVSLRDVDDRFLLELALRVQSALERQ
ncbi:helix-turn-helix domain-containing protein [Prauserella oleivorans]